jgi:site-specific DNA recombinase
VTRRAVLYARVSGDDRQSEDRNLLSQLDMCRTYAQDRGYQIMAELHEDDQGASGAEFELPQLNHIRDLARAKAFDVLVVRELDRLSRNLAKQLTLEES